jgi:hypothetical protein
VSLTKRILLATLAVASFCAFLTGCWWLGGCDFSQAPQRYMLGVLCGLIGPVAFIATMVLTGKEG